MLRMTDRIWRTAATGLGAGIGTSALLIVFDGFSGPASFAATAGMAAIAAGLAWRYESDDQQMGVNRHNSSDKLR